MRSKEQPPTRGRCNTHQHMHLGVPLEECVCSCTSGTHMMLEAMTALLSLPRVISHRFSRSRMTVTKKRFSCSSCSHKQHTRARRHTTGHVSTPQQQGVTPEATTP